MSQHMFGESPDGVGDFEDSGEISVSPVTDLVPVADQQDVVVPAQAAPVTTVPAVPTPTSLETVYEPAPTTNLLGLSLVMTGVGAFLGYQHYKSILGVGIGSLFGGAAVNLVRALRYNATGTPDGKREALVSGTYAVLTAAAAGWLAYKNRSSYAANEPEEEEKSEQAPKVAFGKNVAACKIRAAGP